MQLSFDPVYQSPWIAGMLTVMVVAMLIAVRPAGLPPFRARMLFGLRTLAAIALVLTLFRPALIRSDNRPATATLAIAVDGSRSMTLASGEETAEGAATRWQQVAAVVNELAEELSSLDETLQIQTYRFAAEAEQNGQGAASDLTALGQRLVADLPTANRSDVGSALGVALASARATPLAGVVVIGDGTQNTASEDPIGANSGDAGNRPFELAKLLGATGVPLWTVGVGPPAGTRTQRNLAIENLPQSYQMFSGNETVVALDVRIAGYSAQSVSMELVWVDATGSETVAATREVSGASDAPMQLVEVPLIAPEPGEYQLIARCPPLPGETILSDNRQVAFVTVRGGGGRVLYLEGTPRLEQTFLRRSLRRFPDLDLTYRWIPRDTAARWPIDLGDDLARNRFDVVLLGDVHRDALGRAQLQQLVESVGTGTALLTIGGEHAYGAGGYGSSPLTAVLPIEMDARIEQPPGGSLDVSAALPAGNPGQVTQPVVLVPIKRHPIVMIGDRGRSESLTELKETWRLLPPMPGANRWPGIRIAPGVETLLSDESDRPMLAIGEYGQGRVASLAFDSTWLWWRAGNDQVHRRFWRQLMLWLLSREESTTEGMELRLDTRRLVGNGKAEFQATWAVDGETDVVSVEIRAEAGQKIELSATEKRLNDSAQQGDAEQASSATMQLLGTIEPQKLGLPPGIHQLTVQTARTVPDNDHPDVQNPVAASVSFEVVDDTRELTVATPNHELLRRMAESTSIAGGSHFRPDQVAELVEEIRSNRRQAERVVIEKRRWADGPKTGWLVWVVFAGSLSIEWILRRRWGLA